VRYTVDGKKGAMNATFYWLDLTFEIGLVFFQRFGLSLLQVEDLWKWMGPHQL